jgi:Smr domain
MRKASDRNPRIDLHDLTVEEALRHFISAYNALVGGGFRGRIEVIHGYGSSGEGGVIRRKLRAFLAAHADRFNNIVSGDALGNPGVTFIDVKGRLPATSVPATAVESAILAFCQTPKAENKILIKLIGRFGDPAIRAAIRDLVRSGSLEVIRSGAEVKYRAT